MTEFISRKYGQDGYEIIIKTDSEDHYKAAESFARRLIGHEKPKTNADNIRAMNDAELAGFIADKLVAERRNLLCEKGHTFTATEIEAARHTWYCVLLRWLRQRVEE